MAAMESKCTQFYINFMNNNSIYYRLLLRKNVCRRCWSFIINLKLFSIKWSHPIPFDYLEHLFNLKFAVKDLERQSKKCDKQEKQEKAKAKKAIAAGNVDVARIHAENAIRQKSQKVNYLRMSARVDAVASRVQSALTTRNVMFCLGDNISTPTTRCFDFCLHFRNFQF